MFKLIATIYILMNGQPVGEPAQLTNKLEFVTLEDCKQFLTTDMAAGALERLNAQIVATLPPGGTHTVTASCEKAVDNTI